MRPANIAIPILTMIGSVALFVVVGYFSAQTFLKGNENTNSDLSTNLSVNTNAEETVEEETTNTNSEESVEYGAPTGPFSVSNSNILAVALRQSNDKLVTRLLKINTSTGKTALEAALRTPDIQKGASLPALPASPGSFEFGDDGDSVLFTAAVNDPPSIGIYRTSFTDPKKIETLVQYNQNNLYKDDIPTISWVRFHAATNTVAYAIAGQTDTETNDVLVMNALDKNERVLKSYSNIPSFVGFPGNGTQIEVLWQDVSRNSGSDPEGIWQMDQIRLSDDTVVQTILLINEAVQGRDVHLSGGNISPNNRLVGTGLYSQDLRKYALWFRTLSDGNVVAHFLDDFRGGDIIWAPDSGKVVFQTYDDGSKGVIFDLALGEAGEIEDYSSGLVWYPGPKLIYTASDGKIYSYTLSTGKSVELVDITTGFNHHGGGGLLRIDWVNR